MLATSVAPLDLQLCRLTPDPGGPLRAFDSGGPLEQPFYGYLYRNGYGYLYAQKAMTAAKVACAQDLAGDSLQQLVSGVQQRGFTAVEAQAIVFAMQKQNNSDAYEPLC